MSPPTSSFTASRVNPSTFLIVERDLYGEHPFIYVKIHPDKPVIVLSDTGCDEPAEDVKHGGYATFPSHVPWTSDAATSMMCHTLILLYASYTAFACPPPCFANFNILLRVQRVDNSIPPQLPSLICANSSRPARSPPTPINH